ncbi:DNA repair exonuclease [Leptolyngbya sp. 'hensonii']|uniref:metallophosphoesterase family protein n=1 Tax=Leptolyngbya sp. 'hensonii' TaxID=1922337 RepID=UPI00094F967F|nr:DNA repair exonuclease [Leptolyngbya sp. 'hensonii']OLP19374.1 DNA repair exonuclease [Leptolyngbya sp. 'hensonii']
MPRFLHLADIHLGYNKYDNPQRTMDFFRALRDVVERYAIGEQVDFVLIVGDLFEYRNILPATLNQAQVCLDLLREANIPVVAVEGNHDYEPFGTKASWLRYLADWDRLILLDPESPDRLEPWTAETKQGGYIDLDCGVRLIGSRWYRSSAPQMLARLATAIEQLPSGPDHTVMLLHHGLEGQIARYTGALRYADLLPLQQAGVDYLALGHIHKHYQEQGWIYNPGSLEANSIVEGRDQMVRGVYLVDLNGQGIQAELKQDYYQRAILRLSLTVNRDQTRKDLEATAIALIQTMADRGETQTKIVELRIQGQVGFNRLDLNVRDLQKTLHQISRALIFLVKYDVAGTRYESPISRTGEGELPTRGEIERMVFLDLIAAYSEYQGQGEAIVAQMRQLKEEILAKKSELGAKKEEGRAISELYTIVEGLMAQR